ncbi:electron transfer flavoprotein subunit beta/FixA family protein [Citricoccus sp. NR2]|uniref:electron transfer flavoprotein subunit beta/FixA family protein n=1 Tax=Citricoccus sp. NR2 TaxID=3004095 RepID=UPI0022DE7B38|nr:electron transfer flavoprotein subunit beta/FixA family protein [Citricoccus sp. NR2]WBL20581.1 electron transfer flavoprotein subunit beta/FixA family protein [Citricoccus sp. NR2]
MHLIVLVKWAPDAQQARHLTDSHHMDRGEGILSELDEYPLETALQLREALTSPDAADSAPTVRITALTMGPAGAAAAVKKALQMGADDAVHLSDSALTGADVAATSLALRHVVETLTSTTEESMQQLVLTGMASTDGETAAVPAQLAERLGWALVTRTTEVSLDPASATLTAVRHTETETQRVSAPLPAVVTVTDQANTPRYPSFKAIMAAKKKPSETWSLTDIGLDAAELTNRVQVLEAAPRPPREAGRILTDEGDGAAVTELVEFLSARRLI